MNSSSRLTVADCRIAFGDLFASSDFIPLLNQGCEFLLSAGRWKGSLVNVSFDSSAGYITLPYEYLSLMGINIKKWTPPIFSQFHRYIESGPGQVDETAPCPGFLMDMGDGFPCLTDIPTDDSTLRVVIGNIADANKTIRIYGNYQGKPLFDQNGLGYDFTPNAITTNGVTQMDEITGIEMPVTATGAPSFAWPVYLYSVAPDATATLLSIYYPPDIRPNYHRYQVGTVTANTDGTSAIQCLCQRRFIPVYKETDWVYPGSLRAVKAAMQAVQSEDANNYEQAESRWTLAFDVLNKMVHSTRGAAKPELNFMPAGMINAFDNVN